MIFVGAVLFLSCTREPNDGKELLNQMREKYNGKWYNQVAFEQDAISYENGDSVKKEVWYEASKIPGNLIIKFNSLQSGDGMVFTRDSMFIFQNDSLKSKQRRIHDLLVLSLDVYIQPLEKTCSQLTELGYDLSKIHSDTWQGKDVYVVGALEGDTISKQFWIEKEHLLFVRLISEIQGKRKEVLFNNYKPLGNGWIENEVIFKLDNAVYMKEEYYNIRIPDNLNDEFFSLNDFKTKQW